MAQPLGHLTTAHGLLCRAEELVDAQRRLEVTALEILLCWADMHSGDPQDEPGAVPVEYGGPRLVQVGGAGTPEVPDLSLAEVAIARSEGIVSTRRAMADALDLRHRLRAIWDGVQELRCPTWVARKVATMSRPLTLAQAHVVDTAVAEALDQSPSRILALAEAKVIEADPVAHQQRIAKNRKRTGVWFEQPRPGDLLDLDGLGGTAGVSAMSARLDHGLARHLQDTVDGLAAMLEEHAPPLTEDQTPLTPQQWRAKALAMLADPAEVLAFLDEAEQGHQQADQQADQPADHPGSQEDAIDDPSQEPAKPRQKPSEPRRSRARLFIHLSLTDLTTGELGPLARVEGFGPMLTTELRDLLGRDDLTITPVIDLNQGRSVTAYEHPADVKLRTELRAVGDVFPHSVTQINHTGRSPDHDHARPYDPGGPPGQTGDHNDAPLTRHHHRAKTHLGYQTFQLGPDTWLWATPNGLFRKVTSTGTTRLTTAEYGHLKNVTFYLTERADLSARRTS